MKHFFEQLFEYNHHFNQQLAEIFVEHQGNTSAKAVKLYSHILNAHAIWNHRIQPAQNVAGVWDLLPANTYQLVDDSNYKGSLQIIEHLDLGRPITYTNTKGQTFSNTISDILFHVINHSTYHRGQIASEFKLSAIEPPVTDYIFYKR